MYTAIILVLLAGGNRPRGTDVTPLGGSEGWRQRSGGVRRAPDLRPVGPLFSLAPATSYYGSTGAYAGLPATDGCVASITGGKGEAITFTRATTRWCGTSGDLNEATGVTCASGEVCVRTLAGKRGVDMCQFAGTNLSLRSEELDNASWTKEAGVSVSADDASCPLAPDGTRTMDLVTFNGTSGKGIYQTDSVTATTLNHSIWVAKKTGGAACTLGLKDSQSGVVPATSVVLTSVPQRISYQFTTAITSGGVYLREVTAGDCVDACVWGAQTENNAFATPYIKTTTASATRNTESMSVASPYGGSTAIETQGSVALTYVPHFTAASGINGWLIGHRGNSRMVYFQGTNFLAYDGTVNPSLANGFTAGTAARVYNFWTSGASASSLGSTTYTLGGSGYSDVDATNLRIGEQSSIITGSSCGLVHDVCLDYTTGKCR